MRKVFRKKVVRVGKDGKRTNVDAPEALAERALELGLKGPLQANIEARKLAEKYGHQEEEVATDLSKLTLPELYLYGYLVERLLGVDAGEDPKSQRILAQLGAILEKEGRRESEEYWDRLKRPAASSRLGRSLEDPEEGEDDC